MTKRVSIDEIVAKRKFSATENGELYKAVILDGDVAKAYDAEARSQRFVMSTETADLYGDIVRQDGIKMDNFIKNPVALAYHNHRAPIGWWKDVSIVKGRPKRTEGLLTLHAPGTTDQVDEIERLLAAAAIKACSIGFMPLEAEWIVDDEGRNTWGLDFKESSLLECSVCSIPANPEALAKAAGGDMRLAAELFERVLDTYCEEKSGGLYVRKEFADLYKQIRGNRESKAAPKAVETIVVDIDTAEAKQKIDGLMDHVRKSLASIFGVAETQATVDKWAEYREQALTFTKDSEGAIRLADGCDWVVKTCAAAEAIDTDGACERCDATVIITTVDEVAEYRVVGEERGTLFLELQETRKIEPKAPELVHGSRAKAKAELAKLRATVEALT